MRILCVSDQVDPLVYSTRIRERFGGIDLVLSAGDLPLEYLGYIASMLNCPLLYVEGNHDSESAPAVFPWGSHDLDASFGTRNTGFRLVREGGISILGLPGSIRYNGGPNQFSDLAMSLHILALVPRLAFARLWRGRAVDIVLTHAPPRGIHDREDPCHRGFGAFRLLMRYAKPSWFVHGHIHLYDLGERRVSVEGATTIVNAFGHWIIDTATEGSDTSRSSVAGPSVAVPSVAGPSAAGQEAAR
jgi:Icc-related predicted phosphoesterase